MQVFLTPSALKHVYWPRTPKEFDAFYTKPHTADQVATGFSIVTLNEEAQELSSAASLMCDKLGYLSQTPAFKPIYGLDVNLIYNQLKICDDADFNPNEPFGVSLYRVGKLQEFMNIVFNDKWPTAITGRIHEWMLWPKTFATASFMSQLKLSYLSRKDARISVGPMNASFKAFTLRLCSFRTSAGTVVELPAFSVKRI